MKEHAIDWDEFKVQCWNEWVRQDKRLLELEEEGDFGMDMTRIMPNDFKHVQQVCMGTGDWEGETFDGGFEGFVSTCFDMVDDGRGDFYKFTERWFVMDMNQFLVSDDSADEMIRYIIENSGISYGEWDETQERFEEYYGKKHEEKLNGSGRN